MIPPPRPWVAVAHSGGSRLGLGCAPFGNLFSEVSDAAAHATVDAAWEAGVRLFDTAPLYGHGLSETRLGEALRSRPRHRYVLSSKVGRVLAASGEQREPESIFVGARGATPSFDYSRDAILRSLAGSLTRLQTDRLDLVHVHDPDEHEFDALATAFPTLIELRDQGVIGAVGCGMNQTEMLRRFVERVDLDVVLIAGRYTLLDSSAADLLFPLCADRNVDVIVGGIFNSGLLADPMANTTYDYATASAHAVRSARRLAERCAADQVALSTAAVQFSLGHPAVTSALVGARLPGEIAHAVASEHVALPDGLLTDLTGHAPL